MCAFNVIIYVVFSPKEVIPADCPSTGDTIPHVIAYLIPSLARHAVLSLLVDRRAVILLCTVAVSFPLSLHRDIVKLSKSSSFGECELVHCIVLTDQALVSMMIIVTSVVFRGVAVDPSLRGSSPHVFSIIRPGVFEAIGVISFAVGHVPYVLTDHLNNI